MTGGALIVEHDPELQSKLARELTLLGYQVVGASTGDGALALMSQWPVDVVVVDEDLPGGGLELTSRIFKAHSEVPVVILSEQRDVESQLVGRYGIIGCLPKSVGPTGRPTLEMKSFRSEIDRCLAACSASVGAAE